MKSISNKRAVITGVFIFLAIAGLITAVLTLGNIKKSFGKTIAIKTVFDDVSGLQTGNNVWFSGVKIGTVKKIKIHGKSLVEVTMKIEEKSQQYIRKDAKAKIGSEGLIGNKIVVIYGGTSKADAVDEGDQLAIEKSINTDDMMTTLQENNLNLLAITNNFKIISKKMQDGSGTVGKLLNDDGIYNKLEGTIASLKIASANTQKLTSSLAAYSAQLQQKGSLAHEFATDTIVFQNVKTAVGQLNDLAANLKNASASLNNDNSPAGVLLHDSQSANDLKATLKNLESGTQKLDENMEALQHNFLLRGFFKKKAKQEAKANK